MFRTADIRTYDPECDAMPANQPQRAKATASQKSTRSRYAVDPEAIAAGRLPQRAPVVTSAANPHYQKHDSEVFPACPVRISSTKSLTTGAFTHR
jgi:hypothetical protein